MDMHTSKAATGLVFMNNVDFQARRVRLRLDESIGLKAPAGTRLKLIGHFPDHAELVREGRRTFRKRAGHRDVVAAV